MNQLKESLGRAIREISEEWHCAGWNHQIEYDVWRMLRGGECGPCEHLCRCKISELNYLSNKIDGWIAWDGGRCAAVFVPMDEWLKMFKEWENE